MLIIQRVFYQEYLAEVIGDDLDMESYEKFSPTLSQALGQSHIAAYLHLERYWNDGSPSGFHSTVSERFSPFSQEQSFLLPVHTIDHFRCTQVGNIAYSWVQTLLDTGKIPIPIHPDIQSELIGKHKLVSKQVDMYLEVVPTASGRTVFCKSAQSTPHFIKLHYPRKLGRFTRDLSLFKWLSGIENSRELFMLHHKFPACFGFLHEPFGTFVERYADHPGFGVIYREFTPRPLRDNRLLLPAFSLFAKKRPENSIQPLLIQLLANSTSPLKTFINSYIRPVLISYVFLATECGLIPECNAQNVLFEIDLTTGDTRFILRDMSDIFKDLTMRQTLGLHISFCTYKSIDKSRDHDFFQRRSFAYDFKLGEYLLHPLAQCFSEWMKIPLSQVIGAIREEAQSAWSGYSDYFYPPNCWYIYPQQAEVRRDSYVEVENPTFR